MKHKLTELAQAVKDKNIHVILLEESWLDASINKVGLPNFTVISRRDRSEGPNRGGVIGLVRQDVNNISFLYSSTSAERSWHVIQRDTTSIAICNWYFSPSASLDDIDSLEEELTDMQNQFHYVVLTGDLNTHHKSWLNFSRDDTPRGAKLKHRCDVHGLKQIVRQPTRGPYLLDLVLTDHEKISYTLGPKIADHHNLIIHVPDSFEERQLGSKHMWHYRDADWLAIEAGLINMNWLCLQEGTIDEATDCFYKALDDLRTAHVPQSTKPFQKSSLPWLNQKCEIAITSKHLAEGSANYSAECKKCRETLDHEHGKYKTKLRQQIASLPRGFKR